MEEKESHNIERITFMLYDRKKGLLLKKVSTILPKIVAT